MVHRVINGYAITVTLSVLAAAWVLRNMWQAMP